MCNNKINSKKTMKTSIIRKWTAAGLFASGIALCQTASAISLDLTTANASGSANGGFFQQVPVQPTGSGVIDSFVRIKNKVTEEGFNTGVSKLALDNLNQGGTNFNHDIQLNSVPLVNLGGTDYYQFLLDIDEAEGGQDHSKGLISLFELEIWTRSTPIIDFAGDVGVLTDLTGSGADKKWDLDLGADGDSVIELDSYLNPGNGKGDMFAYIPASSLGNDGSSYVYLYSKFGSPFQNSGGGYEEWSTVQRNNVPDGGATVALMGLALGGLSLGRRFLKTPKAC
jgi:hypothetical protein